MKYRIISVLMVLAMVASLCVVAAVPATADSPDVQLTNVEMGSHAAGASNVSFDLTVTEVDPIEAGDIITFRFDSSFDLSDVDTDTNTAGNYKYFKWAGNDIPEGMITVTGNDIILSAPADLPGAVGVFEIYSNAGVGNPNVSQETDGGCLDTQGACVNAAKCGDAAQPDAPYKIRANGDPFEVQIYDYVKVDGSSFAIGDTATITGVGFSPNATLHISGGFQGSGLVGSDGTVEITAQVVGETNLYAADTTGRKACIAWAGNFNLLPTLEVTPSDGRVCTPLIIEGYNYAAAPAQITIGGDVLVAGGITLQSLDSDGVADDFRVTGVLIPPTLGSGQYQIVAGQGSDWFEVDGKEVTVDPAAGPPGTTVTVEGSGFCPTSSALGCAGYAIMMYGNTTAGEKVVTVPIQVDDQGSFVAVGKIPDAASDGLHGVLVYFNPAGPNYDPLNPDQVSAQGTFTVTDREITLVPNNIPFGTTVTLSGGDFGSEADGATPDLFVNYADIDLGSIDNQELSSSGDIIPVTFKIDDNLGFHYGDNIVEIKVDLDNDGNYDMTSATTLTVKRPTLEIDPSMGPRGTKVTATGSGWLTGQTDFVTIIYEKTGEAGENTFAIVSANADGDIWTQFDIPPMELVGNNEIGLLISAKDGSENTSLKSIFTVTVPTVTVEPDRAAAGDDITVIGSGFRPKNQVQEVSIGGAPIVPVYELGLTDSKGSFTVKGTVPGVMEGGQVVTVRVTQRVGNGITVPFTVTGGGSSEVTVDEGFATIEGKYIKVWTFDSATQEWQVYDTTEGAPSDFDTLNSGQGYWVEVSEDCTLTFGAHTWNLKKGWNLIGWLG